MDSSVNEIFRFIQLRPIKPQEEAAPIPLQSGTALAKDLLKAPGHDQRAAVANAALLQGAVVRAVSELPLGNEIMAALSSLEAKPEASTQDLIELLPDYPTVVRERNFKESVRALSDTLLASYFATQGFPKDLCGFQDVFRVYRFLSDSLQAGHTAEVVPLADYMKRLLLAPLVSPDPTSAVGVSRNQASGSEAISNNQTALALARAVSELAQLDRRENLVQPGKNGAAPTGKVQPFTLTSAAKQKLSPATAALLKARGIDLGELPIEGVVEELETEIDGSVDRSGIVWPKPKVTKRPGLTLPQTPHHALVRPVGAADLLVVKQQIKRYEASEIAHVENVLIGEKKSRAHRQLERSEETVSTDVELTSEKQTELETADRFELNRETARTIQEAQASSMGLTLSAKYGPSVQISSNYTASSSSSESNTDTSSSHFARDVIKKSLDRITERTREQRTRTVIRETEETNLHELNNTTGAHVRGLYQFIDKVYEAQIFNYGIRAMFDFIVPEPASFLWHVESHPNFEVDLPPAPQDLNDVAPDATYIDSFNAPALAAAFGASDIEPAPALYKVLAAGTKHGDDNASEDEQPHSCTRIDVQIPEGYRPLRARVFVSLLTDNAPAVAVTIGTEGMVWTKGGDPGVALNEGKTLYQGRCYLDLSAQPYEVSTDSKLGLSIIAWETNSYAVEASIVVKRTREEYARWQLATYKKIRAAYEDAVRVYEQKVEALRSQAEAASNKSLPFGAPPAENKRTILMELKKHCISIITRQRYDAFNATKDGDPPYFDFHEAAAEGCFIRFFEQAFEWDQLQYVFYPYFWSRKETWIDRFMRQDVDPEFLEFIRAGAARVVVPLRPGFEVAVAHFLETGKLWGGEGAPPQINNPTYVSIVDEIRERTGAPGQEIPVGDPWEVRVPTALVRLRDGADLPQWERVSPDEWSWRPVEGG